VDSIPIGYFSRRCAEVVAMDVKAVVVVGPHGDASELHVREQITGTPYALADVLGKPLVFRTIDRLKRHGITDVAVVTDVPADKWPVGTAVNGKWIQASGEQLWSSVEQAFNHFLQKVPPVVLLIRLGAYAEIDFREFLQFHLDCHAPITSAIDGSGIPLDVYALSPAHRPDAAYLLQHQLRQFRDSCKFFSFTGYINRLSSPNHLRQLAIEGLMRRVEIEPEGEQLKPGVWVGRGAQVHKRARVLSPAFIGAGSRVRAAAVVTRCSALEHHTVVDCGTVVENVTTLPYTYVGAGLDITHSVVGHSKLFNLKRDVEVEFADPRLIGEASSRAPLRALGSLISLASFFPAQFLRGLFASSQRERPTSLPEAAAAPAAALETPAPIKAAAPAVDAGEFPSQLVIARRYGNE
jgi:NDP-sugar pyrophosphorylase family protein